MSLSRFLALFEPGETLSTRAVGELASQVFVVALWVFCPRPLGLLVGAEVGWHNQQPTGESTLN
jgi:hypothetical protein